MVKFASHAVTDCLEHKIAELAVFLLRAVVRFLGCEYFNVPWCPAPVRYTVVGYAVGRARSSRQRTKG